ncbi:MAG: hypothetical protein IID61_14420 [SAR324 cluster bacterium]|nr:hypothetical protein [SAR324 cluster bacterium]
MAVREAMLPIVQEAARRIGAYSGKLDVRVKAPHDYVTRIDIEIEHYLLRALTEAFPDHRVVGEESFHGLDTVSGPIWIVDPLDGTTNVIHRLAPRAVSVALLFDGLPVVGAICDPIHDEMFDAVRGYGARLNGQPLSLAGGVSEQAPIGISSGFILWCEELDDRQPLLDLGRRFGKFRIMGSQALQLCYVADARLRANLSREAKIWDDAAGALIVDEAGGWYGDITGRAIFPVNALSPAAKGEELFSLASPLNVSQEISALFQYTEFRL